MAMKNTMHYELTLSTIQPERSSAFKKKTRCSKDTLECNIYKNLCRSNEHFLWKIDSAFSESI